MKLTRAELAEGRRLLELHRKAVIESAWTTTEYHAWLGFVDEHADALLARPEEIAREAVREFAEALFSNRVEVEDGRCSVIYEWRLVKEARARGVTLDEPEPCPKCGKGACRCE